MKNFRFLMVSVVLLLAACRGSAPPPGSSAAAFEPYSAAAFDARVASGKPVAVESYAHWCPTCRLQAPAVAAVVAQAPYDAIAVMRIDFDEQKDALRRFGIDRQSTLVVFRGGQERARASGVVERAQIAALFDQALR